MSIDALNDIPHITIDGTPEFLHITAPDGFSLTCIQIDTLHGKFWRFDPASKVTDITHFNLRYLINQALNS